ncbi:MAG TPA: transposase [Flavisolibacter sp.]|nr:transposase [Flavisolibacter sp.]
MYNDSSIVPPVELRLQIFHASPLGALFRAIPFEALACEIPPPPRALSGKGCRPWFDVRGGIALQILKSYYRCSDAQLIELLNGNYQMQWFCGMDLKADEHIKDKGIVSRWRTYLGKHLDMDRLQIRLVQHWRPYMEHPHSSFCDATMYESYITYPSDAKLLWRSIQNVYEMIQGLRKQARLRRSRIRHDKRKARYLSFARKRKKTKRENKGVCKWLLPYLERLVKQLEELQQKYHTSLSLSHARRLSTIYTLKAQQQQLYVEGQPKVPNRIVSLHKPYVRPIIRGKEVKPVEFGVKANLLQVDGINFIEHVSYDNFNEGTRLKSTIRLQRRYFGACYQMGADAIYATNENRRYCTKHHIATSFVPKGKEGKLVEQKSKMRSILAKVRATVLEGSFGNEKNHYLLNQINARTQANEKVWLFFSMLTANAKQIARRMQTVEKQKQAA